MLEIIVLDDALYLDGQKITQAEADAAIQNDPEARALIEQQAAESAAREAAIIKGTDLDRTVEAQAIPIPTIPTTATTVTAVRTAANTAIAQLTAAANDRIATLVAENQKDREALAEAYRQLGLKE